MSRTDLATETPLSDLLLPRTPNATFFERSHGDVVPQLPEEAYRFEVAGPDGTRAFSLADLRALPRASETITLACSGNGRTGFEPVPGGVPWGFGAISTARWDGVRLRDVLAACGPIAPEIGHAVFDGFDPAPDERRPPYRRSIPLERALADGTLVADAMNGEDIPSKNGGPVRVVVGGWTGNHAMKWLRRITLAREPDAGHWMVNDYRIPGPDGTLRMIETAAPIAIVASPANEARVANAFDVQGIAYGEPAPRAVRIEIDGRHAGDAPVRYDDGPLAWGRWTARVTVISGLRRLSVRAADADGTPYPPTPWNAGGYCYNGPHAIEVVAGSS
ncbi:MAG TPA: molybdopterin-dependent oxidoreductase [Candidatus Elarobacter sp.]|nr:molybdopterin-dependent oxidoreductase [Candidatus Elarobacter sp.]